jgi:hypothetical protein
MPQERVCFAGGTSGPPETVPAFLGLFPAQEMAFLAMVEAVGWQAFPLAGVNNL